MKDMERRIEDCKEGQAKEKIELEAKLKEMDRRLEELEEETEDSDKKVLEASKLRMEVEELREGIASNNAPRNPSLPDFPIVLISAWQPNAIASPQTVTFDSFLTNYNTGGGDEVLDLDSGVFTCLTSGYYSVSFSARGALGLHYPYQILYLFMNGTQLPESGWQLWDNGSIIEVDIEVIGSQIVVSNPLGKKIFKKLPR